MSDTFYIRLEIANEFEKLATEIRSRQDKYASPLLVSVIDDIADAIDERASKIRGKLQREADQQARDEEDHETKPWRVS